MSKNCVRFGEGLTLSLIATVITFFNSKTLAAEESSKGWWGVPSFLSRSSQFQQPSQQVQIEKPSIYLFASITSSNPDAKKMQLPKRSDSKQRNVTYQPEILSSGFSVNSPEKAMYFLSYFQDSNIETTLELNDMNDTPVPSAPWKPFISGIKSLNEIKCTRDWSNLTPDSLQLLADNLTVSNLKIIEFPPLTLPFSSQSLPTAVHNLNTIIKKNPLLEKIKLPQLSMFDSNYLVVNNLINDLPPLPNLRKLDLKWSKIDDDGLKELSKFLLDSPLLEKISIASDQTYTNLNGLSFLAVLIQKNLKNLKSLFIYFSKDDSENDMLMDMCYMLQSTSIEKINFGWNNKYSNQEIVMKQLGVYVSNNKTLKKVILPNLLGSGLAAAFLEGWAGKGNLESLNLVCGSYFGDFGDEATQQLATCLKTNIHLKEINLGSTKLSSSNATLLASAFEVKQGFCALKGEFSPEVEEIFFPLVLKGKMTLNSSRKL